MEDLTRAGDVFKRLQHAGAANESAEILAKAQSSLLQLG
jgi:hypothetical protein